VPVPVLALVPVLVPMLRCVTHELLPHWTSASAEASPEEYSLSQEERSLGVAAAHDTQPSHAVLFAQVESSEQHEFFRHVSQGVSDACAGHAEVDDPPLEVELALPVVLVPVLVPVPMLAPASPAPGLLGDPPHAAAVAIIETTTRL
jgi:hypothetical protein